jgi:electron-transferring-flavoprotein dehydrogenase
MTYGGSFLYHMEDNQVAVGFVVGPRLQQPVPEPVRGIPALQDAPQHPLVPSKAGKPAKRIGYGARALTAGGLLSLPKTVFPGGALVGCEAGYLNASRIKGSHAAIKTGMLAAEAAFDAVQPAASTTS